MCRKLMLLSCLVTLLGLSNIAFAAEFEVFKVDFSCPENPATVKGGEWLDFVFDHGCDGEEHDGRWGLIDAGSTRIDVYAGRSGGHCNLASRDSADPICNTTHYTVGDGVGCGETELGLRDLDPSTTYTVYTYHAWSDGDITSVTVVGADSCSIINLPQVVNTASDEELLEHADVGEIEFTTDAFGSTVNITFGGCTRFNAFELWSDTALPTASSPNPSNGDVCPNDVQLSWTPGGSVNDVNGHDVYFGTDYNNVRDANRTNHPGLLYYSRGQDSNEYPEDGNPLLGLDFMTTYYWRVDEINDTNTWTGSIWSFTTEDGNARDPDPVDGFVGLSPDANVLSWTPSCVAASQDVYFSTDFSDVNEMKPGAKTTVSGTDNNITPTLAKFTTYYWRIKTTRSGAYSGTGATEVWKFSTGLGGLLLEMEFEGTKGTNLPCTVLDTSGNLLDFTNYSTHCDPSANGEVKYDDGRRDGNSAVFDPCCGLYRQDTGESDPLRLAGWQYTIEMWAYLPSGVYPAENAWYMIAGKQNGWKITINDPGQDDDIRWYHRLGEKQYALIAESILPEIFDEWVYIAAVFDKTAQPTQKLYIDAAIVASGNYQDTAAADNNTPVGIGVGVANPPPFSFDHYFEGKIDEFRIWDIVVVPEPEYATQPFPPDGSRGWEPNGVNDPNLDTFTWKPGKYAATSQGHKIYFGDSIDDVNESADPCATLDSNSWTHGKTFETGKTYFWRVDEVNGLDVYPGHIWKFQMWADLIHPNIVVYYPLDETSGDFVPDYSGNYFDAECGDTPHWEPDNGRYGGCMHFSMEWVWDAYYEEWDWTVEPGNIEIESEYAGQMADMIDKEISICVWVNGDPNQSSDDDMVVFEFCDDDYDDEINGEPNDTKIVAVVPSATGDVVFRAGTYSEDTLTWTGFEPVAARGTWQHFVFIKNDNDANMYIYLNTELVATKTDCNTTSLADVNGSGDAELELKLGAFVDNSSDYHGRLDEFQIYNKALNEQEIQEIFRGGELEPAWAPSPYDGQGNVLYDTDLSWKPGVYVADTNGHQVYFGTNWQDISDVNSSNYASYPNVEYSHQDACSYDPCGLLELGQTYYWRVDEVNEPNVWTGRIWRFTVADSLIIDDMEDYTEGYSSDYPITRFTPGDYGWDCGYTDYGTGSGLDLVTATNYAWVPARGAQSMTYLYANDGAYYSEIANHFELDPNDWTTAEVEVLTLWFYGEPDNASSGVEQMYVGLEDTTGGASYSEVRYGDRAGEDINDIAIAEWQEWNIALNEFTTVNLEDVNNLYIGFGDRNSSQFGGSGLVYFDDIRLYPPMCILSERSAGFAELDMDDDCIIGFGDVEIMADEWLEADVNLGAVTQPSDNNQVGWWNFDEDGGAGSVVTDSSSNGHDGTLETLDANVWWVAGVNDVNYALNFNGGRVRVPDHQDLRPLLQVSVSAWIKYSDQQNSGRVVAKGVDGKETYQLEVDGDDDLKFTVRDGNDPDLAEYPEYDAESVKDAVERDEWVHVAGTYDGNSLKAYVNGELVAENSAANSNVIPFLSQDTNDLAIGNKPAGENDPFIGIIDDVRVYDYGLSAEEIGYLASDGTGIVSTQSIANVYDDPWGQGAVNFKDFDKLAAEWLKEDLFP